MKAKLDETLYCSYTYKENSDTPGDIYLLLTFGSGCVTRRAVLGCVDKPAQGIEKGLFSDPAHTEVCGLVSKEARTDPEVVYESPLTEEELEPLKSSLWFHDKQDSGGRQGQGHWITRLGLFNFVFCSLL